MKAPARGESTNFRVRKERKGKKRGKKKERSTELAMHEKVSWLINNH